MDTGHLAAPGWTTRHFEVVCPKTCDMPGSPACGHALMSMNRPLAYVLNSNVITWMAARLLWQPSTDWWTGTDATLARRMIHKYLDNSEAPSPSAGTADLSDARNSWVGTTARTGGPIKHFVTTIMASFSTESVIALSLDIPPTA